MRQEGFAPPAPERLLCDILNEAGIYGVNPETLRLVLRDKWQRISILAHAIHDAKPKEKTTREKLTPGNAATFDEFRAGLGELLDKVEVLERRMSFNGLA